MVDHERIAVEVPGFGAVRAELVGDDPVTDIAVLRIEEGAFRFADAFGAEVVARRRLVAAETLKAGRRTTGPPAPAIS